MTDIDRLARLSHRLTGNQFHRFAVKHSEEHFAFADSRITHPSDVVIYAGRADPRDDR